MDTGQLTQVASPNPLQPLLSLPPLPQTVPIPQAASIPQMSLNPSSQTMQMTGQLSKDLEENHSKANQCQWQGIRDNLQHRQNITHDTILLQAIQHGVKAPLQYFLNPNTHKLRNFPAQQEITETIGEYLKTKALRPVTAKELQQTKYWVPIFGRAKKGSEKVRLITDLRDLNQCHNIQQHHPQT